MVPFGFLVGAVLAVQLLVLLRRTRFGFEVAVIADSPPAARYAGMRNRRTVLAVLGLSGAVAGLVAPGEGVTVDGSPYDGPVGHTHF